MKSLVVKVVVVALLGGLGAVGVGCSGAASDVCFEANDRRTLICGGDAIHPEECNASQECRAACDLETECWVLNNESPPTPEDEAVRAAWTECLLGC